jgi:hypothetical protein
MTGNGFKTRTISLFATSISAPPRTLRVAIRSCCTVCRHCSQNFDRDGTPLSIA